MYYIKKQVIIGEGKMFELVPALAQKSHIIDLKLCSVLFEDNAFYPWVILVPKIDNVKNMLGLCMEDRLQLMREIDLCEEVMSENFTHNQIDVAVIGNLYPQLNVHIVCRKTGDADWPNTVWNNHSEPYKQEEKEKNIAKIKRTIMIKQTDPKYMQGMRSPDYSAFE